MVRAVAVVAAVLLGAAPARADPGPDEQWAVSPDSVFDLPGAWSLSQGAGVVVAVVDSGVRLNHPDLASNLWTNPAEVPGNGRDDDGNGYVDDVHGVNVSDSGPSGDLRDRAGHGTHVAGTIAAAANSRGVIGVAYRAKLMTVKVLDGRSVGSTAALAAGIRYAAANGARIINISLETPTDDPRVRAAVADAAAADVLIVCSAGNTGANVDRRPLYPVAIAAANLVGVAATAPADDGLAITRFSNYGRLTVPVAAPGEGVVSTAADGGYESRSGTSMAAPHVAGVAALMASIAPRLSAAELRGLLLERAVRPARAGRPAYVDALGSVLAAQGTASASLGQPPSIRVLSAKRRGTVIRVLIGAGTDVRRVRVRLDGREVSQLRGGRSTLTLILRGYRGTRVTAEALTLSGRRVASATARVGGASPEPRTISLSGSAVAVDAIAAGLRQNPHDTRFELVGGGSDMGIADAARGIVDAGLIDRPLRDDDPPGLVITPFRSETLGFVTRGAPRGELRRLLEWIVRRLGS